MAPNAAQGRAVAVEKPVIQQLLDGIEKTLYEARNQAERIDAGVDRIKSEPRESGTQPPGLSDATRPVATVEARLLHLGALASQLLAHLGEVGHRLDKVV